MAEGRFHRGSAIRKADFYGRERLEEVGGGRRRPEEAGIWREASLASQTVRRMAAKGPARRMRTGEGR